MRSTVLSPSSAGCLVVAVALSAAGCTPRGIESEAGLFVFQGDEELVDDPPPLGGAGSGVAYLGGSLVCPDIEPAGQRVDAGLLTLTVAPDPEYRTECFTEQGTGIGELYLGDSGRCAALHEATGVFRWELLPRSCGFEDQFEVANDGFAIEVHAFADVDPLLVGWAELLAERYLEPYPETEWPADTKPVPAGDVALWAGAPFGFRLGVQSRAPVPELIGYRLGEVLEPGEVAGAGQVDVRLDVLEGPGGTARVVGSRVYVELQEGTRAELIAAHGAEEAVVARLHGVGRDDIAELDIQAAWDPTHLRPGFARAIVRSTEGHLVYGAPVGWYAWGALEVSEEEQFLGEWPDYAEFSRASTDDPEPPFVAEAHITAGLAGHLATKDVSWEVRAPPAGPAAPPAPPAAGGGCSQAASSWPVNALALFGFAIVVGRRRAR